MAKFFFPLIFVFAGVQSDPLRAQTCVMGSPGCVDPAFACSLARQFKRQYGVPILVSMVQAGKWNVSQAASMAEVFKNNCPDAN